jgi:ACS family glucarate transporter-like MFS transporter
MGLVGLIVSMIWLTVVYAPNQHPRIGAPELDYIERGGALVNMDLPKGQERAQDDDQNRPFEWRYLKQLVSDRMMLGIYLGQYCINALTYFFITWFPVYLVQQRGMSILNAGIVASIPAICGFAGGVLGGIWSDFMLKRGFSLTASRKTPIVAGMLLSTSMVVCNYVDAQWIVVAVMALAFFGKGVGALGWAVVLRHLPEANRRAKRRIVQYVRQPVVDLDPHYHRLHHSDHGLIQ